MSKPDEKGEGISRIGLNNLEREWKSYQRLSSSAQGLQRREVGILRDAKSGKDFYKYVRDEIGGAPDKAVCALNIASQVASSSAYLINAATDLHGRRGLNYLKPYLRQSDKGKAISEIIDKAMRLWDKEAEQKGREFFKQNMKAFSDNFPKFSQEFGKEADKQGYEVTRTYFKEFTGCKYEIRAVVKQYLKGVEVETFDGKKERIYIGEKDIRIGGFDISNGDFLPASSFVKHGTVEPSILQPDDILLLLGPIAKKTGELLFRGIGKAVAKETATLVPKLEEKMIEKGVLETAKTEKILAKELVAEAKSSEVLKDTAQDLSKTLGRDVKGQKSLQAREVKDTQRALRREDEFPPNKKTDASTEKAWRDHEDRVFNRQMKDSKAGIYDMDEFGVVMHVKQADNPNEMYQKIIKQYPDREADLIRDVATKEHYIVLGAKEYWDKKAKEWVYGAVDYSAVRQELMGKKFEVLGHYHNRLFPGDYTVMFPSSADYRFYFGETGKGGLCKEGDIITLRYLDKRGKNVLESYFTQLPANYESMDKTARGVLESHFKGQLRSDQPYVMIFQDPLTKNKVVKQFKDLDSMKRYISHYDSKKEFPHLFDGLKTARERLQWESGARLKQEGTKPEGSTKPGEGLPRAGELPKIRETDFKKRQAEITKKNRDF